MPVLSVVIPCYNERNTLRVVLERVFRAGLPPGVTLEVVAVDDGSTDGGAEQLLALSKEFGFRALIHPVNRGKGAALKTGFENATGDFVVVQDADLEYNPEEFGLLLKPLLDGRADVVFGSRFITTSEHRVLYFKHSIGNWLLTLISNFFTDLNLSDMETCYKMFRREALSKITLRENRFGFEPEITSKVARLGCRVYEVGISYSGRTYAEGKKIRARDGWRALWCILKYALFDRRL